MKANVISVVDFLSLSANLGSYRPRQLNCVFFNLCALTQNNFRLACSQFLMLPKILREKNMEKG